MNYSFLSKQIKSVYLLRQAVRYMFQTTIHLGTILNTTPNSKYIYGRRAENRTLYMYIRTVSSWLHLCGGIFVFKCTMHDHLHKRLINKFYLVHQRRQQMLRGHWKLRGPICVLFLPIVAICGHLWTFVDIWCTTYPLSTWT